MNTIITSRDAILKECRSIVMAHGLSSINMRTVAAACHVAVGSLYYYFPSKADLINATVEDVWKDIFHMSSEDFNFSSFTDCLSWLFERIQAGCVKYPGFFTFHSLSYASEDKGKAKLMMDQYLDHIKTSLLVVLNKDTKVQPHAFNDALSQEQLIDLIFTIFTSMLMKGQSDCSTLIEMVARCIYK